MQIPWKPREDSEHSKRPDLIKVLKYSSGFHMEQTRKAGIKMKVEKLGGYCNVLKKKIGDLDSMIAMEG